MRMACFQNVLSHSGGLVHASGTMPWPEAGSQASRHLAVYLQGAPEPEAQSQATLNTRELVSAFGPTRIGKMAPGGLPGGRVARRQHKK